MSDYHLHGFARLSPKASLWKRLASLTNDTASALRSDALRVATVAVGYIPNNLFKEAHQYPWRLADGNVQTNLQTLMHDASVQDPVACASQYLLRLGFNRQALESAILLFREVPWKQPQSSKDMGQLPPSTGSIPGMAWSSCAPGPWST